jgi:hypothetical protein
MARESTMAAVARIKQLPGQNAQQLPCEVPWEGIRLFLAGLAAEG